MSCNYNSIYYKSLLCFQIMFHPLLLFDYLLILSVPFTLLYTRTLRVETRLTNSLIIKKDKTI